GTRTASLARPRPGPVPRATTSSLARPRPRPVRRTTTASRVLSPGREQSLPRKPRRTPIPARAGGRHSDAGASSTSRPLAKAAAALAPARIRARKGQASPTPTGISATSTRISVRRGWTTRSSCRRSNDDNRDQRILPLVWSALFGTAIDGESRPPEGPTGVLAGHNEGCTDPLIHKSAALSREGSFPKRQPPAKPRGPPTSGVGCSLILRWANRPEGDLRCCLMGRPGRPKAGEYIGSQKRFLG